jgi:hypothetical protein
MVHLRIFYAVLRESNFLKLPIEMIDIVIWISKIVKDVQAQGHIHYISEAVEIWRGADDDTPRPQNLSETFQHDVTRYR